MLDFIRIFAGKFGETKYIPGWMEKMEHLLGEKNFFWSIVLINLAERQRKRREYI